MSAIPTFFLVGAAKSGTSALADILSQHPDVFVSPVKEPYFLCTNPEITEQEYITLFDGAEKYAQSGEATTGYLYDEASPMLIRRLNPAAKILIVLRNPVEMAFSLWQYMSTNGSEKSTFIAAIQSDEHRRSNLGKLNFVGRPENYIYISRARYAAQLERYLNAFPVSQVHVEIYEEFRDKPMQCIQRMYEFLEVDSSFKPTVSQINKASSVRSRALHKLIHQRYPVLKSLIPITMRDAIRKKLKAVNRNSNGVRKISESEYRAALEILKDEVSLVSRLLNRSDIAGKWASLSGFGAS